MEHLVHWDDVESFRREAGPMRFTGWDLGTAARTVGVGLRRYKLDPGDRPTPPHVHGAEEEIFYVLEGAGLSWQDGKTFEIRAGDTIVHRADWEAHTIFAGEAGLDVLAFGERIYTEVGYLPRAHATWLGPTWVEVAATPPWEYDWSEGPEPWKREIAAPDLEVPEPSERPSNIVNVDDVEGEEWTRRKGDSAATTKHLGRAAGSVRTGLNLDLVAEGKLNTSPHCHSAEEEIFVVLDGEGTLLLGDEEHPVRMGHVLARPPGTRIAHAFRGGAPGLSMLCYGTRVPNDITYYPRSGVFALRGVGVFGRIEPVDPEDIF